MYKKKNLKQKEFTKSFILEITSRFFYTSDKSRTSLPLTRHYLLWIIHSLLLKNVFFIILFLWTHLTQYVTINHIALTLYKESFKSKKENASVYLHKAMFFFFFLKHCENWTRSISMTCKITVLRIITIILWLKYKKLTIKPNS